MLRKNRNSGRRERDEDAGGDVCSAAVSRSAPLRTPNAPSPPAPAASNPPPTAMPLSPHLSASETPGRNPKTPKTPGAPRATKSGPRLLVASPAVAAAPCETPVTPQRAYADAAPPTPHLSPSRGGSVPDELALAPASGSARRPTSEDRAGSGLGPWTTTASGSSGIVHIPRPQSPALLPLAVAPLGSPAAPGSPNGRSSELKSVRLSKDPDSGSDSASSAEVDWRALPRVASVAPAATPETVVSCKAAPFADLRAHTAYRFRVQQGDKVLLIETRYRRLHRLHQRLSTSGVPALRELPPLPPKLRGAGRLSPTVVGRRQAAFREFLQSAISALPDEEVGERDENASVASARLQRFLSKSCCAPVDLSGGTQPPVRETDSDDSDSESASGDSIQEDEAETAESEGSSVRTEEPGRPDFDVDRPEVKVQAKAKARRPRLPTPAFGAVAGVIKHKSSRLRARLRSSASSSKSGAGTPGAQTIAELSEQPVADAAGWESDESGL